jgi:hypothetical protein
MPKYFYLGREVTLVGQLGDSIYEIQDPSGKIKRGQVFSVAIAQVDVQEDPPEPEPKSTRKTKSND